VQLNVFNWSDYIHEDVIAQFEEKTGCTVIYDNYSSDSELETRLATAAGSYDVVFPSDRALAALLAKQLLQPVDHERLMNYRHLDPQFLSPPVDPENRFSVPYFWGTLAVGVRVDRTTRSVGEVRSHAELDGVLEVKSAHNEGLTVDSPHPQPLSPSTGRGEPVFGSYVPTTGWEALFDPKYRGRITMLDDMENVVAAALSHLGFGLNSVEPDHLAATRALLSEQRPLVQAYTSDSYRERLISGEAWVALGWSGDLLQADAVLREMQESGVREQGTGDRGQARVRTIVPMSGTMLWFDSMVIPAAARNVELAHRFIDHLLDPAIAALNAVKVNYATPNLTARSLLPREILADETIYLPSDVLGRCAWLQNRGADIERIERVWRVVRA